MKKDRILFFILGLLVASTTVYAAYKYQAGEVGYTPSNSNFSVDNVEDAIEELYNNGYYKVGTAIYYNPVSNTKCTKAEATTNYTQNGNNGIPTEIKTGCMKWYVIHDDGDMVSVISDHNTTARIKWNDDNKNVDYTNSNLKAEVDKLVSISGWKVTPRLITAEEIVAIVGGVSSWDVNDDATRFYFEGTGTNKQTFPEYSTTRSKYAWLYDNLYGCRGGNDGTDYGCEIEDNNNYIGIGTAENGQSYDYWTSIPIGVVDYNGLIWVVLYDGRLSRAYARDNRIGIRPVITISKSIIK